MPTQLNGQKFLFINKELRRQETWLKTGSASGGAFCSKTMKWFKHYSDSYTNLKLKIIVKEFGLEGYGIYWLCLELVAQQGGKEFELSPEKMWQEALRVETGFEEKNLVGILSRFAKLDLIDKKSLKKGILSIPKMREYVDEYTDKVGRKSRQYPDSVRQEKEIEKELKIKTELDKIKRENPIKTF